MVKRNESAEAIDQSTENAVQKTQRDDAVN